MRSSELGGARRVSGHFESGRAKWSMFDDGGNTGWTSSGHQLIGADD